MKFIIIILAFFLISCSKNSQAHPPVGGLLSQKDLEISKNRSRDLNQLERSQIKSWIDGQSQTYYPVAMGYWISKNVSDRSQNPIGTPVNFEYDIYDFDEVKIYSESVGKKDVQIGKFEDLKAVENAVRYLKYGEQVTLLVPSGLAYGTYGDNEKILNDVPLIIKIKMN